jgi:hypothetical protein
MRLTNRRAKMFQVTVSIADDSDALSDRMVKMRTWLDGRRFEPSTFRYAFSYRAIVCRVDFTVETEAETAFDGKVIGGSPEAVKFSRSLILAGWRFFPAEQVGHVLGAVAAAGARIKDRDISDFVKERVVRVVDVQGGWEAKTADGMTAEEVAGGDTIAIRGPAARSTRRAR